MTHTLWLLKEEATSLQLPPDLLYIVQHDELHYKENLTKKIARQSLFTVRDANLQSIFNRLMNASSSQVAMQIVDEIDMRALSFHDQLEIWYTAGPDLLTTMIVQLLSEVQSQDDVEFVSSLTIIRHTLFGSKRAL